MACFDNLIALKELCTTVTPKSGFYLNDVGVDLNLVQSVITKEYSGPAEFINRKIEWAIQVVKDDVYSHFADRIKVRTVIENNVLGYSAPDLISITGGNYRGVTFSVVNNANYFSLEIASIGLHTDFTGTIPVLIYDLDQNLLLDTVNIDVVAGNIGTEFPHLKYASNKKYLNLWIGYDATAINSYKTLTHKGQCCGVYCLKNSYVRIQGASVTGTFIQSNVTDLNNTAGVHLTYSLYCDPYGWMCNSATLLTGPILHKVASELYRLGLWVTPTTRSNNSTTVQSDLFKANFEYHEMEYQRVMNQILPKIYLPTDSVCFLCNTPARYTTTLP